jgi:hypothetical protein
VAVIHNSIHDFLGCFLGLAGLLLRAAICHLDLFYVTFTPNVEHAATGTVQD